MSNEQNAEWSLSADEEEILTEYDSRLYGFINFDAAEHYPKKCLITKAIHVYESKLKQNNDMINNENKNDECKWHMLLGHFYLLLGDFAKSLNAYQKCFEYESADLSESTFLYGLGIVYFHFGAYRFTIKSFLTIQYRDPGFIRTNEINFRLALIYKHLSEFELALKHFKLALNDSYTSVLTKPEIKFCIAHLYETNNKHSEACEKYDELLKESVNELSEHGTGSHSFTAKVMRQLGWLYFYSDELSGGKNRAPIHQSNFFFAKTANSSQNPTLTLTPTNPQHPLNHETLNKCIELLTKSTQYDASQCLTWYYLGRAHATKGNTHEAFNAYRSSVNSTESNADTWCSIGVLYQQQSQAMDALQAYICAVQLDSRHHSAWLNLAILYETVQHYQDALTCYQNALTTCDSHTNSEKSINERINILKGVLKTKASPPHHDQSKFPSLNEAFSLPIPAELTQRQNPVSVKTKMANGFEPALKRVRKEPQPLSQQQMTLMRTLEQNRASLTPEHAHMLHQLSTQHNAFLTHQHQYHRQLQHVQQQQQPHQQRQIFNNSLFGNDATPLDLGLDLDNIQPTMNLDLNMLLSHHDIAEDLRQCDSDELTTLNPNSNNNNNNGPIMKLSKNVQMNPLNITNKLITPLSNHTVISTTSGESAWKTRYPLDQLRIDASLSASMGVTPTSVPEPRIHIEMSAHQIIKSCRSFGLSGVQSSSLLNDKCVHPAAELRESLTSTLRKDQLNPPTPSVLLESKKEAMSPQLQQYCLSTPISVVRGLAGVLKLDLSLFSTKSLVDTDPDHVIEVRMQRQQASDENWDAGGCNKVWKYDSGKSFIKIAKYAQYQAASFQETLNGAGGGGGGSAGEDVGEGCKKFKMIKFGTNIDLSDEVKWRAQLQELAKLPPFMKVISACNMLSHVGYSVLGVNTVQMYMKVPGSRTPGHQENNNFCSLNINIGPGDCEWFGVSSAYWPIIEELCEKNGVDYLNGSWWPNLDDLYENNIPVYRFIQKPGDLVWVNFGCVHWVQAVGWCNNIAWNVGPIVYSQFKSAIERYEWNKYKHYKSIVPIVHLTWNLARNIKVSDRRLFELIKHVLMQSLKQCQLTINYIESCELEMKQQLRQQGEPAHYCIDCDCEVFNILFVSELDKKHVVHCQDCARRRNHMLDTFVILNQFTMDDLKTVYDQFVLHTPQYNNLT